LAERFDDHVAITETVPDHGAAPAIVTTLRPAGVEAQ